MKKKEYKLRCKFCKQIFTTTRRNKRFCRIEHSYLYHEGKKIDNKIHTGDKGRPNFLKRQSVKCKCPVCGKEFEEIFMLPKPVKRLEWRYCEDHRYLRNVRE
jgi:hypothetical protein